MKEQIYFKRNKNYTEEKQEDNILLLLSCRKKMSVIVKFHICQFVI